MKTISEENDSEKTWVVHKNTNNGKNSIENPSPIYQTYTTIVIEKK